MGRADDILDDVPEVLDPMLPPGIRLLDADEIYENLHRTSPAIAEDFKQFFLYGTKPMRPELYLWMCGQQDLLCRDLLEELKPKP